MITLLPVHVGLGIAILVLAIVRVFWRVSTPLPPWAESLSGAERKIAHHTETADADHAVRDPADRAGGGPG